MIILSWFSNILSSDVVISQSHKIMGKMSCFLKPKDNNKGVVIKGCGFTIQKMKYIDRADQSTKVHFARSLSSGFITAIVVNPPERKVAKCISMQSKKRFLLLDKSWKAKSIQLQIWSFVAICIPPAMFISLLLSKLRYRYCWGHLNSKYILLKLLRKTHICKLIFWCIQNQMPIPFLLQNLQ